MRYLNKKTGAVIDSSFSISGGDWVLEGKTPQVQQDVIPSLEQLSHKHDLHVEITDQQITPPNNIEEPPAKEPVVPQTNAKGANDAYDSITVPQIKQELDAFGIEYDKRANKQVLYDLMMSQGK